MIKNQWYAVLSSKDVKKGRLTGVKRLGEDMVFFRDKDGEVCCVADQCPHRGASIGKGRVVDGHARCPFHGLQFDGDGKCVLVPADGRSSEENLSRFNIKKYYTREIGDIIFLWYGEGVPDKELPVFDVMTDPKFKYGHIDDTWNVHYSRAIENQLDVSHLAFVHYNTIGRGNKTLCNGPKVVWLDENTLQTSAYNEVDIGQKPRPSEECPIKSTNLTFKYPNIWMNTITEKMRILAFFVPIDDEHCILSVRFYTKMIGIGFLDSFIAWIGKWADLIVERQDKRVVETQRPKKSSLRMNENLVAADMPIMEYRRRREELQLS